jgi:hypothetical protein
MITSDAPPGSKFATPKPRTGTADLAGQFRDLQRLRRKVRELERRMKGEFRPRKCRFGQPLQEPKDDDGQPR